MWIKTHCLKGEDKWESSRRLDANGPDIEVYWTVQSNELIAVIFPEENIGSEFPKLKNEAYTSGLELPGGF